jgi:type VI protein secretion system component Hcp
MPRIPRLLPRLTLTALLVAGLAVAGSGPRRAVTELPEVDLAALNAQAIYLSVSGFTGGESTSSKHPGIGTATAVSSGVVTTATSTTTGKASPASVVITKPVDSYTPQFAKAVSTGAHISSVIIWFDMVTGDGERDIAKLALTDVLVKQSTLRFSSGATSEVVTLLVRREALTYWPQTVSGLGSPITWCWSFVTNTAC